MEDTLEILVVRSYRGPEYTIGHLYIEGQYFCDTLEDVDRGLNSAMSEEEILAIKVNGKTAIPTGTYDITLAIRSNKFSQPKYEKQYGFCKAYLPRLINVKGYEGVLVHCGNTAEHTDGCLLVGENKVKGQVINSTNTFKKLYKILSETNKRIQLTIK